jgi:hypothetical protein
LYESACFGLVDPTEPPFWASENVDGKIYSSPAVWQGYFFEDYHDGVEKNEESSARI